MTTTELPINNVPAAEALPIDQSQAGRIDRVLAAAAVVAAGTTLLHIFGGGATIARPLLDSSLDDVVRLTLYVVWHMVTVALGFSAVALAIAAAPNRHVGMRPLVAFISMLWIAFGAVFLFVAAADGGGTDRYFGDFGQWIVLMPVGILGLWSLRRGAPTKAAR